MGAIQSTPSDPLPVPALTDHESTAQDRTHSPTIANKNLNINLLYGSGTINNNNHNITNYVDARPPAPPAPYIR